MPTCERHGEITKCLEDHGQRIRSLEVSDATILQKMVNLTDAVKELTSWIKGGVFALCGLGITFIVWYIQNLQV
jgi:hypothetical protein